MGLRLITPPTSEPLTLQEVKTHLRVDGEADDSLINSLILSARQYAEKFQSRALLTQTWELTLDHFPAMPFRLPLPPLQSVDEISYTDYAGNTTVIDAADYVVDTASFLGRIDHAFGKYWPSVTLRPINGVKITFTAGYGDTAADVPDMTKQAMKVLIGHWYENRQAIVFTGTNSTPQEIPFAVTALLTMDRVVSW